MDPIFSVSNIIQNYNSWSNGTLQPYSASDIPFLKRMDDEKLRTLYTVIIKTSQDNGIKFGKFSDSILTSTKIAYFLSRLDEFNPSSTFDIMTEEPNCIGTLFHDKIKVFSSTAINSSHHSDDGHIFVGTFNDDKSWNIEKTSLIKVYQCSNNSNY